MREQNFKLTFLTDIVLNKSSNSEGKIDSLDYITGSSILGILAKNYDSFENPIDIFHSKKVRFMEAVPLFENQITYKVPFCFFAPKLDFDKKEIKNNHFIEYEKQDVLDKQYKQLRTGYITKDLNYFHLDYNYSQKSAYDSKNRKSQDTTMFGHRAIKEGAVWKFSIKFEDDITKDIEDKIINFILGEKYLGKSKTAQYGKVLIEKLDIKDENIEELNIQEITYLYLNSSMALLDKNNMPTFNPTIENLGLSSGEIDWEKTQIRTSRVNYFNKKRENFDYTRLILEKGSVIAIKNFSKDDIKTIKDGVGIYLNEGYGDVLINPEFVLNKSEFSLVKKDFTYKNIKKYEDKEDETLLSFLKEIQKEKKSNLSVGQKVQNFIDENLKKFEEISKSQWGQIRMIVQFNQNNDSYKDKIKDFITKGTSKKQWESVERLFFETLENESIEFIKILSMLMPKSKGTKDEK